VWKPFEPAMNVMVWAVPLAVFLGTVFLGAWWNAYLLYRTEHKEKERLEAAAAPQAPLTAEDFMRCLLVDPVRGATGPSGSTDASVTFHFWLFNALPVAVRVQSVTGRVKHARETLGGGGGVELLAAGGDIQPSHVGQFSLRQWVSPEAA